MIMDITPYIGAVATIVIAIVGGYVAMKNLNYKLNNSKKFLFTEYYLYDILYL